MARHLRMVASSIVCALLISGVAFAQEKDSSVFGRAIKATLLDPTTVAPAIVTYDGTMRDWKTSQPFFAHGFVEMNARFTRSGRPGDVAVSYEVGKQQILRDSLNVLAVSAVHNFSTQLIEQALRNRFPEHARAVTIFGWIERAAVASVMTYELAGPHYTQWRMNQQMMTQYNIR